MYTEYYQDSMDRLDNEAQYWILKANEEFSNAGKHTAEECKYLQHAASVVQEMANKSIGAVKNAQIQRFNEINNRFKVCIKEINPEYYKNKIASGNNSANNTAAAAKTSSGSASAGSTDKSAPKTTNAPAKKDEKFDIEGWLKPIPKTTFDDVKGLEEAKAKLLGCAEQVQHNELKKRLGLPVTSSFLLYGPPGTGKTFLANALTNKMASFFPDLKYLRLDSWDILSKYVGDAEKTIAAVFDAAIQNSPCVLFIDEIDGVCKNRSMPNLPEYASALTTAFLTAHNQLKENNANVILIAGTNYPANVDKAMVDRMDTIEIGYPNAAARIAVLKHNFEKRIMFDEATLSDDVIGELTEEKTITNVNNSDDGTKVVFKVTENNDVVPVIEKQQKVVTRRKVFNQRDIEKLSNTLKQLAFKELSEKYNDSEAVQAVVEGNYKITRELFEKAIKVAAVPLDHSRSDMEIEFFKNGGWGMKD